MTHTATLDNILPHNVPSDRVARTMLVAIRRLAVGGYNDAHATNILMGDFGMAYRRPLMFLRVLLCEVSRVARRQIQIAPCCCGRMTTDELLFLEICDHAKADPQTARLKLARLAATLDCLPALSVAQALADALDDIGHPFRLSQVQDFLN